MYIRNNIRPSIIAWFCWKHVAFFIAYSFFAFVCYHKLGWKFLVIPYLPVGTIGTAVAFLIGFKNNASYERLWDARKSWGAISNLSRAFGSLICGMTDAGSPERDVLLRRQISWCRMLSLQLRETAAIRNSNKIPPEVALVKQLYGNDYQWESLADFLKTGVTEADKEELLHVNNKAIKLLELQMRDVMTLPIKSEATKLGMERVMEVVVECFKEQGATERLKSFPFPRQYAHFSGVFVWIFLLMLPFGLIDETMKVTGVDWLIIPFASLISWMFITMEQVGDSSEDPFERGLNDIPMSAICRNIEIDLLGMLGERNLPAPVKPIADILL